MKHTQTKRIITAVLTILAGAVCLCSCMPGDGDGQDGDGGNHEGTVRPFPTEFTINQ